MEIPNISIAFLVKELKPLIEGARVRKVQELPNNWLKVSLSRKPKNLQMVIAKEAVFLSSHSLPARQETSGFGAFLRKHLAGKTIQKIYQHGFDRVIVMEINSHFLVVELFAKGNIALADSERKILSAYRSESWKDREIRKGAEYRFPFSKEFSPTNINVLQLFRFFQENTADAIRAFIQRVNIAPIMAEEVFFVSGIPKEKPAKEITKSELERLASLSKKFYSLEQEPHPVLIGAEGKEMLLPFELETAVRKQLLSSINYFLDEHFSKQLLAFPEQGLVKEKETKIIALKKSLERQFEEMEKLESEAVQSREKGEAIFANYTKITELLDWARQGHAENQEKNIMYKNNFFLKKFDRKNRRVIVEL